MLWAKISVQGTANSWAKTETMADLPSPGGPQSKVSSNCALQETGFNGNLQGFAHVGLADDVPEIGRLDVPQILRFLLVVHAISILWDLVCRKGR